MKDPKSISSQNIQHVKNMVLLMILVPVGMFLLAGAVFLIGNTREKTQAATLFYASYDNGTFSPWTGGQCGGSWSCNIVNAPGGRAGKVARYQVGDTSADCPVTGDRCYGERAERQGSSVGGLGTSQGDTRWYSWSMYLENGFPVSSGWQILSQWHSSGNGPPPVEFNLSGRNFMLQINKARYAGDTNPPGSFPWSKTISTGQWYDMKMNIYWSQNGDGYVRTWINGQEQPRYSGATLRPGEGTYFKQGYYRCTCVNGTGVVYYDNTRVAQFESDLGSAPVPTTPPPAPTPPAPSPTPPPPSPPASPGQSPYGGTAKPLPGRIEAEDYDVGGQNVAYNDTSATNIPGKYRTDGVDIETSGEGGFNVGYNDFGEWREHTVNVQAGTYSIGARVSAAVNGGKLVVKLDGQTLGTIDVPNTGGWQSYQTVTLNNINIPGGNNKILRFETAGNYYTINWVDFNRTSTSSPSTPSPSPSPTPSPAPVPPAPRPTVSVPGASSTSKVSIPETVSPESDGSLVADFDGDGLNDVAYDSNGDGYIDPISEIALDGSSTPDLTLDGSYSGEYIDPYVTVKVGPLPELKAHRPIAYAFAITQGFALSGMGLYYAITHFVIFAGLRRRLGL